MDLDLQDDGNLQKFKIKKKPVKLSFAERMDLNANKKFKITREDRRNIVMMNKARKALSPNSHANLLNALNIDVQSLQPKSE